MSDDPMGLMTCTFAKPGGLWLKLPNGLRFNLSHVWYYDQAECGLAICFRPGGEVYYHHGLTALDVDRALEQYATIVEVQHGELP